MRGGRKNERQVREELRIVFFFSKEGRDVTISISIWTLSVGGCSVE